MSIGSPLSGNVWLMAIRALFEPRPRHPVKPCGGCDRPIGLASAHTWVGEVAYHNLCLPNDHKES